MLQTLTHTHLEEEEKLKCDCVKKNNCVSSFASKVFEINEKVVGTAESKDCQSRRQRAGFDRGSNSVGTEDSRKSCLQSFEKSGLQSFEKSEFESAFPALKGSAMTVAL